MKRILFLLMSLSMLLLTITNIAYANNKKPWEKDYDVIEDQNYNDSHLINTGSVTQTKVTDNQVWFANGTIAQEFIAQSDKIYGFSIYSIGDSILNFTVVKADSADLENWQTYENMTKIEGSSGTFGTADGWTYVLYNDPITVIKDEVYQLLLQGDENSGGFNTAYSFVDEETIHMQVAGMNVFAAGFLHQEVDGAWISIGEANMVGAFKIYGEASDLSNENYNIILNDDNLVNDYMISQTNQQEGDAVWYIIETPVQGFVPLTSEITGFAFMQTTTSRVNFAIIQLKGSSMYDWGNIDDPSTYDIVPGSNNLEPYHGGPGWNYIQYKIPVTVTPGILYYLLIYGLDDAGLPVAYIDKHDTNNEQSEGTHLENLIHIHAFDVNNKVWYDKDANLHGTVKIYGTDSFKDIQTKSSDTVFNFNDGQKIIQTFQVVSEHVSGLKLFIGDSGFIANDKLTLKIYDDLSELPIKNLEVELENVLEPGWMTLDFLDSINLSIGTTYYLSIESNTTNVLLYGASSENLPNFYMPLYDENLITLNKVIAYEILYEKFTVTFIDYNDEVLKVEEVFYGGNATAPSADVEGYEFLSWDSQDYFNVKNDVVIKGIYIIRNYNIQFATNGADNPITRQSVQYGNKVVKPETPTKKGYKFGGWYQDEALTKPYNFNTTVNDNLILYAKWTKGSSMAPIIIISSSVLAAIAITVGLIIIIKKRKVS